MRTFFIIRQVSTNAVDHHHNERTVIHIQPVRTADQLIASISRERTINILGQVWLIKLCHDVSFLWSSIYRHVGHAHSSRLRPSPHERKGSPDSAFGPQAAASEQRRRAEAGQPSRFAGPGRPARQASGGSFRVRSSPRCAQCASGSGRSWKCTTMGLRPLPPSLSHGARSPLVVHNPLPFQPAFGSSMRPSKPLA
jgi:hypothetical protein